MTTSDNDLCQMSVIKTDGFAYSLWLLVDCLEERDGDFEIKHC